MYEKTEKTKQEKESAYTERGRNKTLKTVFGCTDKASCDQKAEINAVINDAYAKTKKAVTAANLAGKKDMRKSIRKRMLHLLRVKYDDIDAVVDGENTIRQLADTAVSKLKSELKTSKKLSAGLQQYFYQEKNMDRWLDGWVFLPLRDRKNCLEGLKLVKPDAPENEQEADILADFYCRGYNLMYFVFREALVKAREQESGENLKQVMEDPFHNRLLSRARDLLNLGYTTSQINNRELVKMCREELMVRLQLGQEDVSKLIRMLYAALDSQHRDIIWRMFTWEEIKSCVEVKKDA